MALSDARAAQDVARRSAHGPPLDG